MLTLNKPNEALKCYEKALKLPNANISDIYYNMGKLRLHICLCFLKFRFSCCHLISQASLPKRLQVGLIPRD